MTKDRFPAPGSRAAFFATLLLGIGAGAGYGFAAMTPDQTESAVWPAGAGMATIAAISLAAFWRMKPKRDEGDRAPDQPMPMEQKTPPAPEPVRQIARVEDLIPIEGPAIDQNTLEGLRKLGGDDFVKEIASQFVSESVLGLFKLAQAISECNSAEYGAQVHALRSSAANVGAHRLYKLCLEWRELDEQELAASGSARFVQLQKEFSAAERQLKELQTIPMAAAAG